MPSIRPFSARPVARVATAAVVLVFSLAALPALAGPKDDMKAMGAKFLALRSYHVRMTTDDARAPSSEVDFVAPDRYRLRTPAGTQYIIGDTMHLDVGGRTLKVPMPKAALSQWRETDRFFREIDKTQVEALGAEAVDGKPAKKYRMTGPDLSAPVLLWVGADGYPLQVRSSGSVGGRSMTSTLRYSRFDDPAIRIDPPK